MALRKRVLLVASALAALLALLPHAAAAAMLYLDPESGTYLRGDTFSVKVRLDNGTDCVNAVDVRIAYPADTLRAVDVSTGSSILTLFAEPPAIDRDHGIITFAGGVPGGYCGRTAGDPGVTNVLAELIFQTAGTVVGKPAAAGRIDFLPGNQVLLADGQGTPAALTTRGAAFALSTVGQSVTDNWLKAVAADKVPPQPFDVQIARQSDVYGGAWFAVFGTTDKESGIDHYEVMETEIGREGYQRGGDELALWAKATSPYVLHDQSLNSIVRVKAVDKAGNERIAAYTPDASMRQNGPSPGLTALLVLIPTLVAALAVAVIRRRSPPVPPAVPPGSPPPPASDPSAPSAS